jgi:hypothetical protein
MHLGSAILHGRRVPIIVEQPRFHETFLRLYRSIPWWIFEPVERGHGQPAVPVVPDGLIYADIGI